VTRRTTRNKKFFEVGETVIFVCTENNTHLFENTLVESMVAGCMDDSAWNISGNLKCEIISKYRKKHKIFFNGFLIY